MSSIDITGTGTAPARSTPRTTRARRSEVDGGREDKVVCLFLEAERRFGGIASLSFAAGSAALEAESRRAADGSARVPARVPAGRSRRRRSRRASSSRWPSHRVSGLTLPFDARLGTCHARCKTSFRQPPRSDNGHRRPSHPRTSLGASTDQAQLCGRGLHGQPVDALLSIPDPRPQFAGGEDE